jgi:hypothetical protein
LPIASEIFANGLSLQHTKGNLSAIPLKKIKANFYNQEATDVLETIRNMPSTAHLNLVTLVP